MASMQQRLEAQQLDNGYQLVDGVEMHDRNPEHFHVPPLLIKQHVQIGFFVELRIDSPRFSIHPDERANCTCPCCQAQMSKPVLRHEQPESLLASPTQPVPARGWGEDFWVRVVARRDDVLQGIVDNRLIESRLHGLERGSQLLFHLDHILAVHPMHRRDLLGGMNARELKELARWLRS